MNRPMMLVSRRDCSRTPSSRRQVCVAFTRSNSSNGEVAVLEALPGTR